MRRDMRTEVAVFAEAMECKLATHDEGRGERGWSGRSIRFLLNRIEEESNELLEAFDDCDPIRVAAEAVDLANFAMMIHDILTEREKLAKLERGEE
jgi:hypothetical protein